MLGATEVTTHLNVKYSGVEASDGRQTVCEPVEDDQGVSLRQQCWQGYCASWPLIAMNRLRRQSANEFQYNVTKLPSSDVIQSVEKRMCW